MLPKYIATLAVAVVIVTFAASSLTFATRSQVQSGTAVDETLQLEFTVDADSSHTYQISPALAQFLGETIGFYTDGPARVLLAKVEVTPKDVSWTEGRTTITSSGAAVAATLRWDTPADSANGASSRIYLNFPTIPQLDRKMPTFHSGGYQKDGRGRYIVREVTTYRNTLLLSLARFVFALAAGLPFGIALHAIFFGFVVKSERRSRIAQLPPQGPGLPRTFYPNPITEWTVWLIIFGVVAAGASMIAGFCVHDGFMSSSLVWVIYGILATGAAIALFAAWSRRKSLLTIRVEPTGISYTRGRDDLQWLTANWSDMLFTQKSRTYRGNTSYWIELEFHDHRKKLKIDQTVEGYAELRDILLRVFTRSA